MGVRRQADETRDEAGNLCGREQGPRSVRRTRHPGNTQLKRLAALIFLGLGTLALPGALAARDFDPREYREQADIAPTQVMVLGTAHLDAAGDEWDPAVLDPLLDRLAAFRPDVIAIENQPGPTTAKIWAYRAILPEAAATFAGQAMVMSTVAGLSLDMDMPQAEAGLRDAIARLPAREPSPADRRRLAALFAAAGDPHSALVQWWHLPEAERVAGDGVSRRLAGLLDELGRDRGESVLIATRLAVRLGHQRLYQTDSQEEDVFTPEESELFYRTVFPALVDAVNADPVVEGQGKVAGMTDPEATLAEYRKLNDSRINRRLAELEWLGAVKAKAEREVGRKRMAAWEARNLRMAANIREASARATGGRVLVIVGAAHKLWLEAYLGMMADIAIVSTDTVLE